MNNDYFSKNKMMYSSNPAKEAEKEVSTLTNKAGSFFKWGRKATYKVKQTDCHWLKGDNNVLDRSHFVASLLDTHQMWNMFKDTVASFQEINVHLWNDLEYVIYNIA